MRVSSKSSKGLRPENLDVIIIDGNFIAIIDAYDCCEEGLANTIAYKISSDGAVSFPDNDAKMCLAAVLIEEDWIDIFHKGDCRVYFSGEGLITQDDTLAWNRLSQRYDRISVSRIVRAHPFRHTLTQYHRGSDLLKAKLRLDKRPDKIMLCSDGFWCGRTDEDIEDILSDPQRLDDIFQVEAFEDNSSCIVIDLTS